MSENEQRSLFVKMKGDKKLGRALHRICNYIHNCYRSPRIEEQDDVHFVQHNFDRLRELIREFRTDWAGIQIYLSDCRDDVDLPVGLLDDCDVVWRALPELKKGDVDFDFENESVSRLQPEQRECQRQSEVPAETQSPIPVIYVDGSTTTPLAEQNGTIGSPYASISQVLTEDHSPKPGACLIFIANSRPPTAGARSPETEACSLTFQQVLDALEHERVLVLQPEEDHAGCGTTGIRLEHVYSDGHLYGKYLKARHGSGYDVSWSMAPQRLEYYLPRVIGIEDYVSVVELRRRQEAENRPATSDSRPEPGA